MRPQKTKPADPNVVCYTDASFDPRAKRGVYGWLRPCDDDETPEHWIGMRKAPSVNQLEVLAAIAAVLAHRDAEHIVLHTDSHAVIVAFDNARRGEPVTGIPSARVAELHDVLTRVDVEVNKVAAHRTTYWNNVIDRVVRAVMRRLEENAGQVHLPKKDVVRAALEEARRTSTQTARQAERLAAEEAAHAAASEAEAHENAKRELGTTATDLPAPRFPALVGLASSAGGAEGARFGEAGSGRPWGDETESGQTEFDETGIGEPGSGRPESDEAGFGQPGSGGPVFGPAGAGEPLSHGHVEVPFAPPALPVDSPLAPTFGIGAPAGQTGADIISTEAAAGDRGAGADRGAEAGVMAGAGAAGFGASLDAHVETPHPLTPWDLLATASAVEQPAVPFATAGTAPFTGADAESPAAGADETTTDLVAPAAGPSAASPTTDQLSGVTSDLTFGAADAIAVTPRIVPPGGDALFGQTEAARPAQVESAKSRQTAEQHSLDALTAENARLRREISRLQHEQEVLREALAIMMRGAH